jgi:D-3-phosphoglycerate dehydrogenase
VVAGAPRIVEVKGMELDDAFAPAMLYVNNLDKPGFIGALGRPAGRAAGVNIATFNLGRVAAGDADAIALVGVRISYSAGLASSGTCFPEPLGVCHETRRTVRPRL